MCCAPFGAGGRARRVEDPAHGIGRRIVEHRGRRRQRGGIAVGVPVIGDERVHVVVLARDLLGQRGVVEVVPHRRRDQQPAVRLLRDERDLARPVDRQHRVLDRAEPAQRADEHGRFRPRGELPRDVHVGADTQAEQSGRGVLGQVAELRERRGAVAVVEHHAIGRRRDPALDQLPDAARVVDHQPRSNREAAVDRHDRAGHVPARVRTRRRSRCSRSPRAASCRAASSPCGTPSTTHLRASS